MREDLDLDTLDVQIQDNYYDYVSKTSYRGEDFYIVFDKEAFKNYLGLDSWSEFEEYLNDIFGYDNWGYEGEWEECYNCGNAIYMEDIYTRDYWVDYEGSGIYCGDCVRTSPEVRDAYLEYLTNNKDACNDFLSENDLENAGLIKLEGDYEYGYFGRRDNPAAILDSLMTKYPNGRFICDLRRHNAFNTSYTIWAFPGYEEGAIEDEE